jgi:hypothetical protein
MTVQNEGDELHIVNAQALRRKNSGERIRRRIEATIEQNASKKAQTRSAGFFILEKIGRNLASIRTFPSVSLSLPKPLVSG